MLSDKGKRNFWLVIAILSYIVGVWRIFDIVEGDKDWWELVSVIVIAFLSTRFYLCYRKQVICSDNGHNSDNTGC